MSEQEHTPGAAGVWKKPNFLLIVILSCVAMLLVLGIAYTSIRTDSKDLVPSTQTAPAHQN